MDPSPPAPFPARQRVALTVYMFLAVATWGFLQPFTPLYLEASGLA